MFDVGRWGEILIIAVAALILIGPKELPEIMRTCGQWAYRLRRLSLHIRQGLDDWIQQAQFDDFEQQARQKAEQKAALSSPELSSTELRQNDPPQS